MDEQQPWPIYYVAATAANLPQVEVAKALIRQLGPDRQVNVFRPLVKEKNDYVLRVLSGVAGHEARASFGVSIDAYVKDVHAAELAIVRRFKRLQAEAPGDALVALGPDDDPALGSMALEINARVAAHLNASLILLAPNGINASLSTDAARRQNAFLGGVVVLGSERKSTLKTHVQYVRAVGAILASSFRLEPALLAIPQVKVITPLRFQVDLADRARSASRRIVLPEGTEDRILRAADQVLGGGQCALTLLGKPSEIRARAGALGLNIDAADVVDPAASELREPFARKYVQLRAHKGVTLDDALKRMADVSYFGTMMVQEGVADGMVSGAIHTTADTIRPALQIIKTRPGVSSVSSVFLMCLADRVLVYGDCAVNPNPTAEQLADIAISSAETAKAFGVDPYVAMLSYSSGASGAGPDVDLVKQATALVRERAPQIAIDGPLQYDAAVNQVVARRKMPESKVAGRATTFIFPSLSAGNIAYKAVQQSAGATAIGPILQGLNKPVNDLSRGALIDDIVNTVMITAIQAGSA